MKKFLYEIKDYVIIIVAVILVRSFIITPAIVDGASMDDTLKDGQLIIINKINYRINDPKRFQIAVVKNTSENDKIIKRIIGLPNEKVEYKDNELYINDEKVEENYDHGVTEDFVMITGEDEYVVLGDNREVSKDSRMLGTFKRKELIGSVNFRIYPFDKIGKIK